MNKIWSSLILFTFIYAFMHNRTDILIEHLFLVPEKTITLLWNIGGLIILYNGIFQIAIDAKLIERIGFLFRSFVKWLMPNIKNQEIINLVCANITANLLGLGLASTPIALKIITKMKEEANNNKVTKEMLLLLIINVTSFTIFPLTIIVNEALTSYNQKYNSNLGIYVWISLIIITFISSMISLIITKWRYHDIHN